MRIQRKPSRTKMAILSICYSVALMAANVSGAAVEESRAEAHRWFGLEVPNAMSDPTKPVISFDNEIGTLPASFPREKSGRRSFLDGQNVRSYLEKIISFSRRSRAAGELLWGREVGTPAYDAAIRWAAREFKQAGLENAEVQTSEPGVLWFPIAKKVTLRGGDLFGSGSQDVVLQSAFPQINQSDASRVSEKPVTAPLVYVGRGIPIDLVGKDIEGKIAVMHVDNNLSIYHSGAFVDMQGLVDSGAVGVIAVVASPGNMYYYQGRGGWACYTAPCFTVGGQDGYFLERVMSEASARGVLDKLKVTLNVKVEARRNLQGNNAVAILPGKNDKFVVVSAHADGHFDAAGDNGDGFATLIALAHYFGRTGRNLNYGLVFVAGSGHHTLFNGSAAFVETNPEIVDDTVLFLNIEHVAHFDVTRSDMRLTNNFGRAWEATRTEIPKFIGVSNEAPAIVNLWVEGVTRFGVNTVQSVDSGIPGDLSGFASADKPMTQMISAGVWYHSSGDVIETISARGLERAARFHAWFIENYDRMPTSGKGSP